MSTLLNAAAVHKSKYHSLGMSVRRICPSASGGHGKKPPVVTTCVAPQLELTQFVTLVFNPSVMPENEKKAGREPMAWSIRSLFGIGKKLFCLVF